MLETYRKLLGLLTPSERRRFFLVLGIVLVMGFVEMIGVASIVPFMLVLADPTSIERHALLGDVYQSANTVPNILFELLAGGALQAALVPLFVGAHRDGGEEGLASTVGVIGGTVVAVLAALAAALALGAPVLARLVTSAEPDPVVAFNASSCVAPETRR